MNSNKAHHVKKKIAILGAGISGLAAAAYAAKAGHDVHVFEQHDIAGGRARQFKTANGFSFDMGPSWYWMPDIIEDFFKDFDTKTADFFELIALNPQFEMIFADATLSVPKNYEDLRNTFEELEKGSAHKLDTFMKSAKYKYEVGMREFVNKPCHSWTEFLSVKVLKSSIKLNLLSNFRSYIKQHFNDPKLVALMEFPVIFLGASPKDIPALYSLMNYGGYVLGTWYPLGGFYELVKAMQQTAEKQGAQFHFGAQITQLHIHDDQVQSIQVNGEQLEFDEVIAAMDYHHAENLLPPSYRNYSEAYWDSKTFAPSCLIYYIGLKEKLPNIKHHTLFFEHDLDAHIDEIYVNKKWPEKPLFYVCCPSKTDPTVAPAGHENLFLLMPLAIGITDTEELREQYFQKMINRLEKHTSTTHIQDKIVYKRSYCVKDFITDYHAYKGNAYGLANTLRQTAVWKPAIKNKKIKNLHYTGQLTVPGPGVPPSIISGKIVAKEISPIKHNQYEEII